MNTFRSRFSFLWRPGPQILYAVILTVISCVIAMQPLIGFDAREPTPQLQTFVPSQLTQFGEETQLVKTGLYAEAFPNFDMLTGAFTLDGIVWFEFDPSTVPLNSITKFSFLRGTIVDQSEIESVMIGSKIRIQYRVRVNFTSDLDHHRFPLGDHRIYLVLTNPHFSSKELIFQAFQSGFTASPKIDPESWYLLDRAVYSGSAGERDDIRFQSSAANPIVVYQFDFKKPGFRAALTIIVPLFLIFLLSIFALTFQTKEGASTALSLATGSISGLLAYRFVIESVSPKVGYLMVSDHLNLALFAAAFVVFLGCSFTYAVTTHEKTSDEKTDPNLNLLNHLLLYSLPVAVLIATYFIVSP